MYLVQGSCASAGELNIILQHILTSEQAIQLGVAGLVYLGFIKLRKG